MLQALLVCQWCAKYQKRSKHTGRQNIAESGKLNPEKSYSTLGKIPKLSKSNPEHTLDLLIGFESLPPSQTIQNKTLPLAISTAILLN